MTSKTTNGRIEHRVDDYDYKNHTGVSSDVVGGGAVLDQDMWGGGNLTQQSDPMSTISYQDYPSSKPFINASANTRSPRGREGGKAVDSYPESNSKAIVAALKGLQEKIKRLEMERSAAEDNLKSLAQETNQYKDILQKDLSINQEHEPPQSFISKQTDEVNENLEVADRHCDLLEKQLDHMRRMVQTAETERDHAIHETQIVLGKMKEKEKLKSSNMVDKLTEMETMHQELEEEHQSAQARIYQLEEEINLERKQRRAVLERAAKLQTMAETNRALFQDYPTKQQSDRRTFKKKRRVPSVVPATKKVQPKSHYRLNIGDLPFVAGTSTAPSHSVNANLQQLLSTLKTHSAACNGVCRPGGVNDCPSRQTHPPTSSSSNESTDIKELLQGLHDEYGHLRYEYDALDRHIYQTDDEQLRGDLEREKEHLFKRIETKGEQIARLDHMKTKICKKKAGKGTKKRPQSSGPTIQRSTRSRPRDNNSRCKSAYLTLPAQGKQVEVVTTVTAVNGDSPSGSTKPLTPRRNNLELLQDMKKLQTTLRKDDLKWD